MLDGCLCYLKDVMKYKLSEFMYSMLIVAIVGLAVSLEVNWFVVVVDMWLAG